MINIKIKTTNFDKTPAIEDYIYKKMLSLEKYLDKGKKILCEVEVGKTTGHHKSGDIFRAEVNIMEPGGKQFYQVVEESDLYAAIDIVKDHLEEAVVSKRKKESALFRRGAQKVKELLKRIGRSYD